LDTIKAHPLKNKKEFFGERIQTDASIHNWVPNKNELCIHL